MGHPCCTAISGQPANVVTAAKVHSRQYKRWTPSPSVMNDACAGACGCRWLAAIRVQTRSADLGFASAQDLLYFFILWPEGSVRHLRDVRHLLSWFCPDHTKSSHDDPLHSCKPNHFRLESPLGLASAGHLADQLQSSPDAASDRSTCIFGPKRHEPGKPAVHWCCIACMGRIQSASEVLLPNHWGDAFLPCHCQMAVCSTPCAGS